MKDSLIIALIIFSAVMYGFATMVSSVFEQHIAVIYFMSGVIYAAVGYTYANYWKDEDDE